MSTVKPALDTPRLGPDVPPEHTAVLKLMTVQTSEIPYNLTGQGMTTIGQYIDSTLQTNLNQGRVPAKLVLLLNPPREPHPADMG